MGDAESPHAELEQLRRAMETRPVIDQAHGVLMAAYRCTPPTAWKVLVAVSQHANVKLHKVAAALVRSTQGEPLPEPLSSALRTALQSTSQPPPASAPPQDDSR
ncbi:ANTAR domain-containing protein [Streptomyces ovatisporus]|uniref:ANTAR domain-containing protein n=1 Tax=Streptomyces ovatisporus TaxID=1128682 RepID=A0ABV9A431_9ACTN